MKYVKIKSNKVVTLTVKTDDGKSKKVKGKTPNGYIGYYPTGSKLFSAPK